MKVVGKNSKPNASPPEDTLSGNLSPIPPNELLRAVIHLLSLYEARLTQLDDAVTAAVAKAPKTAHFAAILRQVETCLEQSFISGALHPYIATLIPLANQGMSAALGPLFGRIMRRLCQIAKATKPPVTAAPAMSMTMMMRPAPEPTASTEPTLQRLQTDAALALSRSMAQATDATTMQLADWSKLIGCKSSHESRSQTRRKLTKMGCTDVSRSSIYRRGSEGAPAMVALSVVPRWATPFSDSTTCEAVHIPCRTFCSSTQVQYDQHTAYPMADG